MAKVKVATVWLESCAGCHMSFLDIDEAIIDLAKVIEFSRSPITDIKEFVPVDVGIVEGSVGNTEQEEVLKELRAHCKILMAWGDCACFGGVCAMRNTFNKEEVLRRGYIETESTYEGKIPSPPGVPALLDEVKPANHIVKVDCYVPGCPPEAQAILYALKELLAGRIPVLPSDMMRFD
ncbi:MAG: NADP oxidoreductase [Dehalococcoidia bacterium]|nr:MAG: NADP oxidoreductase [Dehalococcoidia bacterium]